MRRLKKIIFVIFILTILPSYAAIKLELTQGVNSAIPIAIVPFANQTNNVPNNTTMTAVIQTDLQNSGEFRVIGANNPSTDLAYWKKQSANDVILGKIQQINAEQYQVSFQLINLYAPAGQTNILLDQKFTVTQSGLRVLAHHISNLIYQQLTGVRGIFSTKIAYILVQRPQNQPPQYNLIVADEDGFDPRILLRSSQPLMSPTWMPNGKKLAYVSFENNQASIYEQDLRTGNRQLISQYPGINNAPAFSPNGNRLALVLTRTGNPNIYIMDLQTKQLTQITNDYSIDTEPTWSPDGKSIYFTSNRTGDPEIYRYDFATRQTSRITFDGNYNARACVSPDNNMIALMHRENGLFSIAKQDLSSGKLTILTQAGLDDSPSLAPNGKMVLYGSRFADRGVLGMVSMDGRVKLRLPAQEGSVQDPAWSPFLN
ncbi:MAG: Tol-Pal system beta propeller repeat protein TolB [Gammaproteobacteria bacterium RIFCSPHIGHO2_12_FULL_38_14]|nr:MAG: Tol-Pal system beta propeller repeat protein TolB [Gammaproteobacteria bacterium RIFCSPHIGHO2_12_FULL_38_14]